MAALKTSLSVLSQSQNLSFFTFPQLNCSAISQVPVCLTDCQADVLTGFYREARRSNPWVPPVTLILSASKHSKTNYTEMLHTVLCKSAA